jgi:hypothetical protein
VHADFVTNGLRVRGFAGLPDGSKWVADEIVRDDVDGGSGAEHGVDGGPGAADAADAAGVELARRMQLAGADDVLREAEAMAG